MILTMTTIMTTIMLMINDNDNDNGNGNDGNNSNNNTNNNCYHAGCLLTLLCSFDHACCLSQHKTGVALM